MRQMDTALAKVVGAAVAGNAAAAPSERPGPRPAGLGLPRALAQTKTLLGKLQAEYAGYAQDGYEHKGYVAFSKALKLL